MLQARCCGSVTDAVRSRRIGVRSRYIARGRFLLAAAMVTLAFCGTGAGQAPIPLDFNVMGVSADGTTVVGSTLTSPARAVRWTQTAGTQILPVLSGTIQSRAADISADGSTIVGFCSQSSGFRAVRWTSGGVQNLGELSTGLSGGTAAYGVSADGSVVVGESHSRAFRWTSAAGMQNLGTLGPSNSSAYAVSADGAVVAGYTGSVTSWRWTVATGMVGIAPGVHSLAKDMSADGSVIAGSGFIWRAIDDSVQLIPCSIAGGNGESFPINADGTLGVMAGCMWGSTMESVRDYLVGQGADLTGWASVSATAMSQDARSFAGNGVLNGQPRGWVITLGPGQCRGCDTDGDGLEDRWEAEGGGIDINDDGVVEIDLFAMGARVNQQDLFVEVDAAAGLTLSDCVVTKLETAFANAPVPIPPISGVLPGIRLHIIRDNMSMITGGPVVDDNMWNFLKALERGLTVAATHSALQHDAWKKVSRYGLIVHERPRVCRPNPTPPPAQICGTRLGTGELDGDDFILTYGVHVFNDGIRDVDERAGAFMHELGHNLGLQHGGGDSINGKPNYPSVMNYAFIVPGTWNSNTASHQPSLPCSVIQDPPSGPDVFRWRLDYCREELPPLDENFLDERVGVGRAGSFYRRTLTPIPHSDSLPACSAYPCSVGRCFILALLDGSPIDFDVDCVLNEPSVRQDLNWFGPLSSVFGTETPSNDVLPLEGQNDWAHVRLRIGTSPAYLDAAVHQPSLPTDEPTVEDIEWMRMAFPNANPCAADLDDGIMQGYGDGAVTIDDLLFFLFAFEAGNGAADLDNDGDAAQASPDGAVTIEDLLFFLARFEAGC